MPKYLLALLTLLNKGLFAQTVDKLNFKLITEINGLCNNDIKVINKDYKGFYWLGTTNGLTRYDGSFCKNYSEYNNTNNGLYNNYIVDVSTTPNGNNYYTTQNGPSVYNEKTKQLTKIALTKDIKKGWGKSFCDNLGRLWLSDYLGITIYETKESGELKVIKSFNEFRNSSTLQISQAGNTIYVCNEETGLHSIDLNSFEVKKINELTHNKLLKKYTTNYIRNINWESSKIGWANYDNKELLRIDNENYTCQSVILNKNINTTTLEQYSNASILKIPNSKTYIAIGAGNLGLNIIDANTLKIAYVYKTDNDSKITEALKKINYLYFDDKACLLIGTKIGLLKTDWEQRLISYKAVPKIAKNKEILYCFEDSQENLWINTNDGYIIVENKEKEIILNKKIYKNYIFTTAIKEFKNKVFIGNTSDGIHVYDLQKKQMYFVDGKKGNLNYIKNVQDFELYNDSLVFILNSNLGLSSINLKLILNTHFSTVENKSVFPNRLFNNFALAKDNKTLWLTTKYDGYYSYDINTKKAHKYLPDTGFYDGLKNSCTKIALDDNGDVYISTLAGIIKHTPNNNKYGFLSIPTIRNEKNFFYISIKNNLLKTINKASVNLLNLTPDNLYEKVNAEIINCNIEQENFSEFYNKNKVGFIQENKIVLFETVETPTTFIAKNIIVNEIYSEGGNRVVYNQINVDKEDYSFTTNYKYNNITIELGFPNQPLNYEAKISYAIDGGVFVNIDKNIINFNELGWGKHKVEVKVYIDKYKLLKNNIFISLYVKRPWYVTWWFILFITSAIILAIIWRIKRLNKIIQYKRTLNEFATSLYKFNKVDEIYDDLAQNIIRKLGFKNCEIYTIDYSKNKCIQVVAYDDKKEQGATRLAPLEISLAQRSIVAKVAKTGKPIFLPNTINDPDYWIDDRQRWSEICIPIIIDHKVFGIINCEDEKKNFFKKEDFEFLKEVANICSLKITKYIVQQNIREEIARDLHDDIGGTLHSISLQTTLATMQLKNNAEDAQKTLDKIGNTSRNMIEKMNDIIWSINPQNDGWNNYYKRAKNFAAEILSEHNIALHMEEQVEYPVEMALNIEARKNLYLFFKEVVTNAAKYSHANTVSIFINFNTALIELKIIDDGIGFDINAVNPNAMGGNGLHNIKYRAKLLFGEVTINSIKEKGTEIILKFPPSNFKKN